jgi:TatD DNase family protein
VTIDTALLVDSHVHLDRYTDEEVRRLVSQAEAAGVHRLLTIGTDPGTSRAALGLVARYPGVLAAVGIHPTRLPLSAPGRGESDAMNQGAMNRAPTSASSVGARFIAPDDGISQLRDLLRQRPSAIGEVGLDEHGPDLARRYLEHGCWISVGRPVTRPSEVAVRQAVPLIPLDRLLLETDTYPLPGRTTEPRDVTTVCAAVADLAGRSYAEVAAATTASFAAFIGEPPEPSPGP